MKKAILGTKIGMTQIFGEGGKVTPVTVIMAVLHITLRMFFQSWKTGPFLPRLMVISMVLLPMVCICSVIRANLSI